MRLSEEKIKAAILDSDLEIRQRAIRYFANSYSTDPSIMPLVIKAVETFGRQDAYHMIGLSRDLPQTEETIAWIIDELNDQQTDQHENYAYNLSMVLVKADPDRHAGGTISSAADFLLLQHSSANPSAALVCIRHQPIDRRETGGRPLL